MSADNFYWYSTVLIFIPWVLLMFMPSWRYTERIAFGAGFILLLAAAYFTISYLLGGPDEGSFLSLDGLTHLFRSKEMLLTGWLNYLSFSLFAGAFQVHDGRDNEIPHLWIVPCLILTFVAGPSGLLLYLGLRWLKTRKWEGR
ncbi:MAG TPA: ABA4-like family protein [Saprospiraceae bacterium]|nr:ABA4-like family protein [Saprospiraceae bacterium]HNM27008.1 ABA4-like family protein [Saprospiraceae bacterium]